MTALQHEITATQISLFQLTGRLIAIADEVRAERQKLVVLLQQAEKEQRDAGAGEK